MDVEKMFYNATMIALEGNPSAMRAAQERSGGLFEGWAGIYKTVAKIRRVNPERAWADLQKTGIRLIFRDEPDFPPLFREIHHAPLAIYVRGSLPEGLLAGNTVSIVGTRRATPEGKTIARRFAKKLADAGLVIVSGLALGIDAAAHEGCLSSTAGVTVAILAGGLDKFYPAENERLGKQILARGGAIISEYPIGEPPYPDRFLERNRIVCAAARGVLVVECPGRSGSLATAAYALQQNRDLFVVPGSIEHPNFFGSHQLIRQGAELVTSPEEILIAYDMQNISKERIMDAAATDEEKQVLQALRDASGPLDVDKIAEFTKLEPRIVNRTLSFLLLKDSIKETESGYIIE